MVATAGHGTWESGAQATPPQDYGRGRARRRCAQRRLQGTSGWSRWCGRRSALPLRPTTLQSRRKRTSSSAAKTSNPTSATPLRVPSSESPSHTARSRCRTARWICCAARFRRPLALVVAAATATATELLALARRRRSAVITLQTSSSSRRAGRSAAIAVCGGFEMTPEAEGCCCVSGERNSLLVAVCSFARRRMGGRVAAAAGPLACLPTTSFQPYLPARSVTSKLLPCVLSMRTTAMRHGTTSPQSIHPSTHRQQSDRYRRVTTPNSSNQNHLLLPPFIPSSDCYLLLQII
ncbi:hypothetical protein BKA80DRAFT_260461 [Phyllosticta citrichinensis]